LFFQMRPQAAQARQAVFEERDADLHRGHARARAAGENVEDQFGAVDDLQAGFVVEVLALAGMQVVVNEINEVMEFNERLLIGATSLSVNTIVELIHGCKGLAVASHIDRDGFGIIGQLGFIPAELDFDALEISRRITREEAVMKFGAYRHIPWISSSDAHRLVDIGRRTTRFLMYHSTFEELGLALKGVEGRKVIF
jgi:hypothetical protein